MTYFTPPEELSPAPAFDFSRERIEAIWRQRAVRLSSRSTLSASHEDDIQVIVLGIGTERYAVDLASVAGVLPPVVCTPVPGGPRALAGIVAVHGEIRPVIDLRRMLGLEQPAAEAPAPVVLLKHKGRQLGLRADRIDQIRSIGRAARRPAGDDCFPTRYVESLTDDTLMLLKTEALFAELWTEEESAV